MIERQIEFDFRTQEEKDASLKNCQCIVDELSKKPYYRINMVADWWCDRVPRWLGYGIYDFCYNVKTQTKHRYQLLRYGASYFECWNLSNNLAKHIVVKLKHFKKMYRHGIPSDLYEKYKTDELASNEWERILDEMIWAFDYISDEEKYHPFPDVECTWNIRERTEREKQVLNDYFKKSVELQERKQKGLELFQKYFDSLWD